MPATFTCASVRPNNGIQQLHFTRTQEQPNHIYFNVTPAVLAEIFGADVHGGDTWVLQATLVRRAGTNGMNPSPLSQKI
jgi:hypothetical protein